MFNPEDKRGERYDSRTFGGGRFLAFHFVFRHCATPAQAVLCPGSGAKVKVTVSNPTGAASLPITLSGAVIGSQLTCTTASGSYTHTFSFNTAETSRTITLPTSGGLVSGMWVHRINVANTTQDQYQQGPVTYTSTTAHADVGWTYYTHNITVNVTGDSGSTASDCPVNAISSPATCDVREALLQANGTLGAAPALIRFAVSPGNITNNPLTISRANITLDGTNSSGNPWIVGDANAAASGNQDPFPTLLDFTPSYNLQIGNSGAILEGLDIRQEPAPGDPLASLILTTAANLRVVIRRSRIDPNTSSSCSFGECTEIFDAVTIPAHSLISQALDITLENVEIRSAVDKGVQLGSNAVAQIKKSWLHNNYNGNIKAFDGVMLTSTMNCIERAGLRLSDDLQVKSSSGVDVEHTTSPGLAWFQSNYDIIRNNTSRGVLALGASQAFQPTSTLVCGNTSHGIETQNGGSPSGPPTLLGDGGGNTSAYNGGHGARVVNAGAPVVNLNNESAFSANALCGIYNATSGTIANAIGDQWRGSPPYPDACPSSPGAIDTSFPAVPQNDPIGLYTPSPTNVMLKGQTIRALGTGFNAIDGNPLASQACSTGADGSGSQVGQPNSCCKKIARANVCAIGTHNPPADHSNCVELRDRTGTWKKLSVKGVTPRLIETEIPDTVLGCVGGSGELLSISKWNSTQTTVLRDEVEYCNNLNQL